MEGFEAKSLRGGRCTQAARDSIAVLENRMQPLVRL